MVPRKKSLQDELTRHLFSLDSAEGRIESDNSWREVPGPSWPLPQILIPDFVAVDFETYYSANYSLLNKDLNNWGYVAHPAFNAYLVALERYENRRWFRWVGHPSDAPWQDCARIKQWVSHNTFFDELVARRLKRMGVIPTDIEIPDLWDCTQDYAAYCQFDRGLDRCAQLLIGEAADKTTRSKAKGGGAGGEEMRDYAGTDARQCGWIWAAHSHKWPVLERYLSRLQRRANYAGFYADQKLMIEARAKMDATQAVVVKRIPWANRYPVTSSVGVKIECAKLGILPPPSLSLDEPETIAWVKNYGRFAPWLEDIRTYTKAQQVKSHIDQMRMKMRKDGTIPFELIYRRAPHTARWQTGGGMRLQNLDRDDFEGFNVRWFISCRPGEKLLNADSSQIEPRVLNWLVGDQVFLDACRKGQSPYDAHAVSTMAFVPKLQANGKLERLKDSNPAVYALAKARLLALGYQAWAPKFCEMARTMAGILVFEDERSFSPNLAKEKDPTKWGFFRESQIKDRVRNNDLTGWSILPPAIDSVKDFRAKSTLIVNFWAQCEREMLRDAGRDHIVLLPNGERIVYFDVRNKTSYDERMRKTKNQLTAWVVKNSRNPKQHVETYGGKLVENRVQRVARELLAYWKAEAQLRLGRFGYKYRWSTHDELNAYVPDREAKHLLTALLEIMSTPPLWARDLPVAAEGHVLDHYTK